MPIATPHHTQIELAPRADDLLHAWSANVGAAERWAEYRLGHEARTGGWIDCLAGVTASLRADGHAHGSVDVRVWSNLPLGGGLSSSASLEVAFLRALNAAFSDIAMQYERRVALRPTILIP
jgi:galactokinase